MNKAAHIAIAPTMQPFKKGTAGGEWLISVESTENPRQHQAEYYSPVPTIAMTVIGGNTYTFSVARMDRKREHLLGPVVEITLEVPDTDEVMIEVAGSATAMVLESP